MGDKSETAVIQREAILAIAAALDAYATMLDSWVKNDLTSTALEDLPKQCAYIEGQAFSGIPLHFEALIEAKCRHLQDLYKAVRPVVAIAIPRRTQVSPDFINPCEVESSDTTPSLAKKRKDVKDVDDGWNAPEIVGLSQATSRVRQLYADAIAYPDVLDECWDGETSTARAVASTFVRRIGRVVAASRNAAVAVRRLLESKPLVPRDPTQWVIIGVDVHYLNRSFQLKGLPLVVLQCLIEAGNDGLNKVQLMAKMQVDETSINEHISKARKAIRKCFDMPQSVDPIKPHRKSGDTIWVLDSQAIRNHHHSATSGTRVDA